MFENLITSFSVGQVDDRLRELGYGGDGPSQTIIRFETDYFDDEVNPNNPEYESHATGVPTLWPTDTWEGVASQPRLAGMRRRDER